MDSFRIGFATIDPPGTEMDIHGPRISDITEEAQWQPSPNGVGAMDGFRRTLTHKFLWRMDLPDLSDADFEAIESFFAAVSGNADEFTYTHTDGLSYVVRFWDQPQYRRESSLLYTATLLLLSSDRPQETSP